MTHQGREEAAESPCEVESDSFDAKRLGGCDVAGERFVAKRLAAILATLLIGVIGFAIQSAGQGLLPSSITGSASDAVGTDDPTSLASIEGRLEAVRQEVAAASASERPGEADSVAEERDLLEAIAVVLSDARALADRLNQKAASGAPAQHEEVASIFALNALYDLRDEQARSSSDERKTIGTAQDALEKARETAKDADKARRQARQEADREGPGKQAAEASLRVRRLAARLAEEEVHLRTLELRARKQEASSAAQGPDLEERIDAMRADIAAGRANSSEGYQSLLAAEAELRRLQEVRARELSTVELKIKSAQTRYSRDPSSGPAMLSVAEVLSAQRDTIRHEIDLAGERAERVASREATWRAWERVLETAPVAEERSKQALAARTRIADLEQAAQRLRIRLDAQKLVEAGIKARLQDPKGEAPLREALRGHADELERLRDAERASLEEIAADVRTTERYLADVEGPAGAIDFMEVLSEIRGRLSTLWNYEITSVDDSPITVGSLLVALLLLGIGMVVSGIASRAIARFAEVRFKLDAGASQSIQTLLFYVLLVSFSLLALRLVHFPLTAFTVLGGALAIGVGFGSQNVMNNFISGLILMLERPVRARDVVEVDGNFGTIERIGARSTQIRSTDGRHIIVPNSFFLESNVVNWTLSDDLVRTSVLIGVIYGSPTRLVEELIWQVVTENEDIIQTPKPIVLFNEFGDNSLNFEVHFWVRARGPMQKRQIESRVRFAIDDVFREHDLVIAFPQRDVHLDSVKPIEVRVVGEGS